jgi:8-oxo-dGTP pyrophosphatase MutT (NUDIX family)
MEAFDRRAARVLLLDEHDALLLIHGVDPEQPAAGTWWITPGGGLEENETFESAARRELEEETGARPAELIALEGETVDEFAFAGRLLRQTDRYFAARVRRFEPVSSGRTDLENRWMLGSRWWAAEEFAEVAPIAFPNDLRERWEAAAGLLPRRSD